MGTDAVTAAACSPKPSWATSKSSLSRGPEPICCIVAHQLEVIRASRRVHPLRGQLQPRASSVVHHTCPPALLECSCAQPFAVPLVRSPCMHCSSFLQGPTDMRWSAPCTCSCSQEPTSTTSWQAMQSKSCLMASLPPRPCRTSKMGASDCRSQESLLWNQSRAMQPPSAHVNSCLW